MEVLNILILVGAIQGFISSILLFFSRKGGRLSNRLLAAITLLISLACLNIYLMQSGIRYHSDLASALAYMVPLLIVMPIGPLIYFYVQAMALPGFKLPAKYQLHFFSIIIDLIPYIIGSIFVCGLRLNLLHKNDETSWRYFIDQFNVYSDILRWGSITLYLYLSGKILINLKISDPQMSFLWPRQFIKVFSAFQFLWLLHLIPYLIPDIQDNLMEIFDWYPVYLPLAVLVYWLGINGYLRNRETLSGNNRGNKTSTFSTDIAKRTYQVLTSIMEKERMFLNPELNLSDVVKHTGISQKVISSVINQHFGKSFNEFVNVYRVNELKKRLVEHGNEHLTIMGLALECGFNSQATMQRTFKQLTKLSPKVYRLQNKSKIVLKTEMNNAQI